MKKLIITLSLISSSCVYASTTSGPYVGMELGAANQIVEFNSNAISGTNGSSYNSQATFMGRMNFGYNVDRNNGFELSPSYYVGQGFNYPNGQGTMNLNGTSLDLSYLPNLPLTATHWSVFGRMGVAYDWFGTQTSQSASNFADVLGAGLRYNMNASLSLRMEWIANGLLFPISINDGSQNIASFTSQQFIAGLNFHF